MSKLEEAINHIDAARRKGSKNAAWNEAYEAAECAGVGVRTDPERPNWPDLGRLETEVRIKLEGQYVINATKTSALAKWAEHEEVRGIYISDPTPEQVKGKTLITCLNQIDLDVLESAREVWHVDVVPNRVRKFIIAVVSSRG